MSCAPAPPEPRLATLEGIVPIGPDDTLADVKIAFPWRMLIATTAAIAV